MNDSFSRLSATIEDQPLQPRESPRLSMCFMLFRMDARARLLCAHRSCQQIQLRATFRFKKWRAAFDALRKGGAPLVPPIIQVAILNREPEVVLAFVDEVASAFPFTRIVPCHFDAPVKATPRQWREAFNFLRRSPVGGPWARAEQPAADLEFLRTFEKGLVRAGTIRPPLPKV